MIKKNITINFCGRLYNIDEDAYQLLNHYTETIRRYYTKQEGGDEIADDIEARIAELLDEKMAQGVVGINIEMTEEIIKRIGNLEDLAPEENVNSASGEAKTAQSAFSSIADDVSQGAQKAWNTMKSDKRFFRDKQNALLAGVLAGFSQYFGGGILLWRLIFVCLVFVPIPILDWFGIGGILVFLYIVMAIIAPEAETPEQVLQMQGRNVNPQNLAEEVSRQNATPRASGFGVVMSVIAKILLVLICFALVIAFVASLCGLAVFMFHPISWIISIFGYGGEGTQLLDAVRYPLCIAAGSILAGLGILTYCTIHAVASTFGKTKSMGFTQRIAWLTALIISIVVCVGAFSRVLAVGEPIRDKYLSERRIKWEVEWNDEHTHDGILFDNDDEWEYFQDENWKMLKAENCSDNRYTASGEYFTGDTDYRYFDTYSQNRDIIYQAEHQEDEIEAGKYSLSCVCRASKGAKGVYMYAVVEKDGKELSKHLYAFIADGNEGKRIYNDKMFALPDINSDYDLSEIIAVNDGKGYGWGYIQIKDIVVPEGATLRYGISTDPEFTGKEKCTAEWFSACDFKLVSM